MRECFDSSGGFFWLIIMDEFKDMIILNLHSPNKIIIIQSSKSSSFIYTIYLQKSMGTKESKIQPKPEVDPKKSSEGSRDLNEITFTELRDEKVIDPSNDKRVNNKKMNFYPYNCIGKLIMHFKYGEPYMGTATLIAPNLVLTALHNLFLNKDKYLKIHFYLYSISQDGTIELSKQIEVIDERYKVQKSRDKQIGIEFDYAILKLKEPVYLQRYIKLGQNYQLINNNNAEIAGFPADLITKKGDDQYSATGSIVSIQNNAIKHTIDTNSGQSGSPIIVKTIDHENIIIGVHVKSYVNERFNVGCLLSNTVMDDIKIWSRELNPQINQLQIIDASTLQYETKEMAQDEKSFNLYHPITIFQHGLSQPSKDMIVKTNNNLEMTKKYSNIRSTCDSKNYPYNCMGLVVAYSKDPRGNTLSIQHIGIGMLVNQFTVLTSINNILSIKNHIINGYEKIQFLLQFDGKSLNSGRRYEVLNVRYKYPNLKEFEDFNSTESKYALLYLSQKIQRNQYIIIGQDYGDNEKLFWFTYRQRQRNGKNEASYLSNIVEFKNIDAQSQEKNDLIEHFFQETLLQGSPLIFSYLNNFWIVGLHICSSPQASYAQGMAMIFTKKIVNKIQSAIKKEIQLQPCIYRLNLKKQHNENSLSKKISSVQHLQLINQQKIKNPTNELKLKEAIELYKIGQFTRSFQIIKQEQNEQGSILRYAQNESLYFNLKGLLLIGMKEYFKAMKQYEKFLEIRSKQPSSEEISFIYNNLGVCCYYMYDFERAIQKFKIAEKDKNISEIVVDNMMIVEMIRNKSEKSWPHKLKFQRSLNEHTQQTNALRYYNHSIYYFQECSHRRKGFQQFNHYFQMIYKLKLQDHPEHKKHIEWLIKMIEKGLKNNIYSKEEMIKINKILLPSSEQEFLEVKNKLITKITSS